MARVLAKRAVDQPSILLFPKTLAPVFVIRMPAQMARIVLGLDDHEGTGQKDEMVNLGRAITRGLGKVNVMEAGPSQFFQEGADPVLAFSTLEFSLKALPGRVRTVAPLDARRPTPGLQPQSLNQKAV